MADTVLGRTIRPPYPGEDEFFWLHPTVAGMAGEDGQVTLNPHSSLSDAEKMGVARNEAIRLHQREHGLDYSFPLTDSQAQSLMGSAYENDPAAARQTVVARIMSGDPSAGKPTFDQRMAAMGTAIHLDHVLKRLERQRVGH
jgi:hypothetical protein